MVPGGFDVTSQATRLMPRISLMMRVAVRPQNLLAEFEVGGGHAIGGVTAMGAQTSS